MKYAVPGNSESASVPQGNCALCQNYKELKRSHGIPNAVFRRILRKNNGKAIAFNADKASPIDYSSESWWEHLLCEDCERRLNDVYERYSLTLLRGGSGRIHEYSDGITFSNGDFGKLQLFFLSIFWRAAVSAHEAYSNVFIPEPWKSEIRSAIYAEQRVPISLATVKVSKLIDESPGGFSPDDLKDLIVSPFFRKQPHRYTFWFLIEGFFIEILTPGFKHKERTAKGILDPTKKVFMVPYLDVFDVPELVDLMVSGYGKYVEGKSKIRS